ncbi:MAG: hypothetical protein AAGF85_04490 [Bacteroidota bacterium]
MKKSQYIFLAFCMLLTAKSFSQTTRLSDLNPFDKIVLDGKVSTLDVSRSHEGISIFIEGAKEDDISASVEAGVLYLKVNVDNALVHVFNSSLKRIEGRDDLEVAGAEVIGRNGRFLITDFNDHSSRTFMSLNKNHFDFKFDHDFDIDLNLALDHLDDLDLSVDIDINDHEWDWNWEWEWDWNWEDHRRELRHHSKDFRKELKEIEEDLKDDLEELKRDLRKH